MDVEDDRVEEVGSREDERIEVEGEVEREMNVQKEDARGGERAEALDEDVEEDVEAEDYEEDMKINGMEQVGGENEIDIPIPSMIVNEEEMEKLIEEQQNDESLKDCRKWAAQGVKGFAIEEGLLVNHVVTLIEEYRKRIVVPTPRY